MIPRIIHPWVDFARGLRDSTTSLHKDSRSANSGRVKAPDQSGPLDPAALRDPASLEAGWTQRKHEWPRTRENAVRMARRLINSSRDAVSADLIRAPGAAARRFPSLLPLSLSLSSSISVSLSFSV